MKLSVVIVSYNQAKYIAKSLDGVVMQKTDFEYEVIVADDCSEDGTQEICREYEQKYPFVRLECSECNLGYTRNWQRAIQLASGEYVAIFEADDYWTYPFKLQKQVDLMDVNPNAGLCYSDCDIYYERGRKTIKNIIANKKCFIDSVNPMNSDSYLCNATWMIRRELLINIKFFFDCRDVPLAIFYEVSLKSKVIFLPETTAVFRIHRGSLSNSGEREKHYEFLRSTFLIKDKYVRLFPESERKLKALYTSALFDLYKYNSFDRDEIVLDKFRNYFGIVGFDAIMTIKKKLDNVYCSKSYRLGYVLLSPIRMFKSFWHYFDNNVLGHRRQA